MGIKLYKPTTPGRRNMSGYDFDQITKSKPEKSLLKSFKKMAGRSRGTITIRHRGGGHKRRYRMVDFKQTDKLNIPGKIAAVEYDPYRTAYITLVQYVDGDKRYHLAPNGVSVGDNVITSDKAKIKVGNRMKLKNIPVGYEIHNLELHRYKGGQILRSAGSSGKIVSLEGDRAQVQLSSSEIRYISKDCFATIGVVSNIEHEQIKVGKAGRSRWKGKRPHVRGKAMNPCDHPHGGGEGRCPIGLTHPKTPWGLPALGRKTRRRKYTNKLIIKSRNK